MVGRVAKSLLLVLCGLVITWGVLTDFENCDQIESRCFYFLAIPAFLPVYFLTHLIGWIGLQLYKFN